jgi:hypothetical protein
MPSQRRQFFISLFYHGGRENPAPPVPKETKARPVHPGRARNHPEKGNLKRYQRKYQRENQEEGKDAHNHLVPANLPLVLICLALLIPFYLILSCHTNRPS